jgi:UDP-glucose 6-dehydrogenase
MVLIGGEYQELTNDLIQLHTKLKKVLVNVYTMSSKAAEITKIGINSALSVKISYANMLGEVITKSGIEDEVNMVLSAIGGDSGVGEKIKMISEFLITSMLLVVALNLVVSNNID